MNERARCTEVRSFRVGEHRLYLYINLETDGTFVRNRNGDEIGLAFDSGTRVTYKNKEIGRIRMSFKDGNNNLHFVLYQEDKIEIEIDTGINQDKVECYLDAEVFVTNYLVENKLITLEE